MAVDREGAPVAVGDLIEVFGHPASGAEVVAVADKGVYAIWRGEQIWVAVRSRRMGENAPIQLQIAPAVAHALGGALLLASADSTTRQTDLGTVPVEVEWHSEYSGGDFDDTGELTIVEVPVGADGCVTDALVNAAFTHAMGQDPIHIIRWIEAEEPLGGYRV